MSSVAQEYKCLPYLTSFILVTLGLWLKMLTEDIWGGKNKNADIPWRSLLLQMRLNTLSQKIRRGTVWYTPVMPALRRLRQDHYKFRASLHCRARPYPWRNKRRKEWILIQLSGRVQSGGPGFNPKIKEEESRNAHVRFNMKQYSLFQFFLRKFWFNLHMIVFKLQYMSPNYSTCLGLL